MTNAMKLMEKNKRESGRKAVKVWNDPNWAAELVLPREVSYKMFLVKTGKTDSKETYSEFLAGNDYYKTLNEAGKKQYLDATYCYRFIQTAWM